MVQGDGDVDNGSIVPVADVVSLTVLAGDDEHRRLFNKLLSADGMHHRPYGRTVPYNDQLPRLQVAARGGQPRRFQNLGQLVFFDRLVLVVSYAVALLDRIKYHRRPPSC